jgi:predicted nuclease of predicted toxin-antitoxin system
MLRFAADENFNGDIVRGLLRRDPRLDVVRVQDVGLSGADDPTVLAWAARENRIVVTHDISTLAQHAFDRVTAGQLMPGVIEVRSVAPIGQSIDDLLLLAHCSVEDEWSGLVLHLPFRRA